MASAAASGSGSTGSVTAAELQHLRTRVPMMTVVEMKGFIRDLNSQCGTRLQVSGTKPMLINRIEEQLVSWQHSSNWTAIRKAMSLVNHPRDRGGNLLDTDGSGANGNGNGTWPPVNTQNGYYASPSYSTQARNGVPPGKLNPANAYRGNATAGASGSSAVRQAAVPRNVRFKPSPFFKVESMLTDTILLIEADSTRRTASLDLRLTAQQAQLLRTDSANYQARLFCAQKASAEISEKNPGMPAFIDFPGSCELRINSSVYTSSLKGSKSKPGRVPPPNLNKDRTLITRDGVTNKIELVYTNAPYKYVMSIGLCKYTPPETIVAKLTSEKSRSREEIIGTMKRAAAEDDIEIGTATLSLKDPLSYTRINYPCRSIHCSHSQCFDALFFFLSNEQSPTWSCPHCSKILKPEDLFIDGYFAHILKTVSEDEDAVIVEADGSWKTRDGKFSSSAAAIPAASSASLPAATNGNGTSQAAPSSKPPKRESSAAPHAESVVPPGAEVVELDDTPSPPRSPAAAAAPQKPISPVQPLSAAPRASVSTPRPSNGSTTIGGSSTNDAIDLTESDDEDMPLAQAAPQASAPGPSTRPPSYSAAAAASGSGTQSAATNGTGLNLQRPAAPSSSTSAASASGSSARPYQSQTATGPPQRPLGSGGSNSSGASPLLAHARSSGFASFSNPPTPSSVPGRASPSGWAGSQPRIVSSTGGMREVRPLAPLWRPGVTPSFSSPGLMPTSAPARAPSREQTAPEAADELPIYPPLLPSRSASTTAASPASSSRDNTFWPASYRPNPQQQEGGSSLSSPLPPSSSSGSRVREREESTDAGGRDSSSKRLRSGGNDDTGVTSFTTRSGRPSAAAGSLREASTPLPSVSPTPSPPPTAGSGHTSTRARDSRTRSAEEEDELSGPANGGASRDDPDYEEEDAPPTRPGRGSGAVGGGRGAAVNSSAAVGSDSPAYTSAPEDPNLSSSTSRSGVALRNGIGNGGGGCGGGGGSGMSTTTAANDGGSARRADSFDDYDGLMDDHDDSGRGDGDGVERGKDLKTLP
ncbi:hypothetical protein BCV69DRAFT_295601 [Microstroma glucosiphilum]|uniref:SP-RING-type domain-containing protein n=1 Tax=Pseudomicrostroma glucosiphilum TaxID=1684307 RepID=A0A316U085_9BASI|nr:hypothetical protein BCV69DRAFT_295601 [Pseudomicrostroma glucosiphilum]PWN17941.1 hypothetical protein BCV69DRAFT_295601 [Pseudomicrostroma glucosiphilum]